METTMSCNDGGRIYRRDPVPIAKNSPSMTLSDKLRSAAKSPGDWDMSGLLNDAADRVDKLTRACKSMLETCGSSADWKGDTRESLVLIENALGLTPTVAEGGAE